MKGQILFSGRKRRKIFQNAEFFNQHAKNKNQVRGFLEIKQHISKEYHEIFD